MNRTSQSLAVLGIATALSLLASSVLAAEGSGKSAAATDSKQANGGQAKSAAPLFSYTPPVRGAPVTRVGGGTRGAESLKVSLDVLAPAATGYTFQGKPTVYWYVSERITNPVELTVIGAETIPEGAKPLLDIQLKPPIEKGMHTLSLADYGVDLKPDHEYQWFVAIVRDPAQRSSDILAGGRIRRVAKTEAIDTKLAQNAKATWPAIYAEPGIWYDAVDELSKMIKADPANAQLRAQRAALLDQVGLQDAAAYDRSASR